MSYKVSQVAEMAHISVRTLHHYDELGLLRPSGRSESGYRLYENSDLERLQQVLFYRELGFPLAEITRIMAHPEFDRLETLMRQREALQGKAMRLRAMIGALDRAIESAQKGTTMSPKDMLDVFGDFDPSDFEDEAKERWGDTDAYKESARRTSRYTKEDWQRHKDETAAVNETLAALLDQDVPADDPRAMDAAELHRLGIDSWFYPCSHEMQVGLGQMYVGDPRFTATYDKIRPGLAQYLSDAIKANAARSRK